MCILEMGRISLYQASVLNKFDSVVHGFTTRKGGVSKGDYESMSLSPFRGDSIENVRENEKILCSELSLDVKKLTATKQEHTDKIKIITETEVGMGIQKMWGEGVDGCITTLKNVPLICYSADCVSVLLYAEDIGAIGAVHSGWRGSSARILEKAVLEMKKLGADGKNIYAAIGPCILGCCYEVGEDVALNFDSKYYVKKDDGKFMLDLSAVNYDILRNNGLKDENISASGICTKCNNDLFFSHRGQNGKSGTLGAIICMRD